MTKEEWLKKAVFYEIYPQSFYDSNGDGIGDFEGIIEKLDYIRDLGADAVWLNPCFDSPFRDAGYDVRDYKKTALRYGTNEDLERLFEAAHEKGIRVFLDLVAGHTSEEHEWFRQSQQQKKNQYSGRYIWTDFCFEGMGNHNYAAGESERSGTYMLNFFKCQPALNYGFLHPCAHWQQAMDSPDALATRRAMEDVMRFWLQKGCDGFRVDMASSLVKDDDEKKSGTCAVWRDMLGTIRREFPDAVFVSEWNEPAQAVASAGFDMDFCLDQQGFGYHTLMRDVDCNGIDHSFFKAESDGDLSRFLMDFLHRLQSTKGRGYPAVITCNHDTPRASDRLNSDELKTAYCFLLTLPAVPFIYYGDEIGMRYQNLPTKEGGYYRTGSRTPMQWNHSFNDGFSTSEDIYLPVDSASSAPTVYDEQRDPDSLLNLVKRILAIRRSHDDFSADGSFEILETGKKHIIYRRGSLVLACNAGIGHVSIPRTHIEKRRPFFISGSIVEQKDEWKLGPESFVIFE